jgi:DNA-binding transcriptional LysR family regulator
MDLMQLQVFIAIVEEGSFTNAASRVYRTQPAVTLALQKLEATLGVRLLTRARRYPLVLTPAGVQFHHYAKCILSLWDNALAAMKVCGHQSTPETVGRKPKLASLLPVAGTQPRGAVAPRVLVEPRENMMIMLPRSSERATRRNGITPKRDVLSK